MRLVQTRREDGSLDVGTINELPTRTQRQFEQQTDINLIMAKYQQGEAITHINHRRGMYADFSQIPDYQSALTTVLEAEKAFMALPSKTRNRFNNNPQELLEFIQNPLNTNEAIDLGLMQKVQTGTPTQQSNDAKDTPVKTP